jgi:hypothetical protein
VFPPEEHSEISPSKLSRIIECPGSFQLSKPYEGEDNSYQSTYAAEGSMLHLAVETYLKKGLTGEVPKDIISPSLDRDQLNAVQDCIDYLDNIMRSIMGDYDIFIEKRVYLHSLSQWLYECDGTCDIIITTKDSIIVIDWKFGQGIPVYADRNDQLYAYAAGAWAEYAPDNLEVQIEVHVVQPRLDNFDSASITSADLHNWITSRVEPSLARAYS